MIKADELVRKLNNFPLIAQEEQQKLIRELFGSVGANPSIPHGFHCDFGCNIHVGKNFYAGYNCTMLDFADITIGDRTVIGAGSVVTKSIHPDVLAVGDPCKVIRKISDHDKV